MRVFHFTTKDYAIENVKNSRLKIATINELNDPFEMYINFVNAGKPLDEQTIINIKNHYNDIIGFLCFSRQFGNPVQWGHYAEKHKGICMAFDFPSEYLNKISYRDSPIEVDITDINWEENFPDATKIKFRHWSYEEEYRAVITLKSSEVIRDNELLFMPFSESLSIKTIYTGVNCNLSEKERDIFIERGIEIIPTIRSRNKYAIESA